MAPTKHSQPKSLTNSDTNHGHLTIYVGAYSVRGSEGITTYRFDLEKGELAPIATTPHDQNPSFLAIHPTRPFLFAVSEVAEHQGTAGGAVSSYAIDEETHALRLINVQPTMGAAPCHVNVAGSGKWLLTANYSGGSVTLFPIGEDGSLGKASDVQQHTGSGPNPNRQERPHVHSVFPDPEDQWIYVADLGIDQVKVYRIDESQGKLIEEADPFRVHPGAGPRHIAFHPRQPFVYILNELDSTVTATGRDLDTGALTEIHTVAMLPDDFSGTSTAADIHLHPSGNFLYASNRGHDSLACFAVDADSGELKEIGHVPTEGRTPRNFALDPTGSFLLTANQESDTIVVFRIDPSTGLPKPTGHQIDVASPVCIKFAR